MAVKETENIGMYVGSNIGATFLENGVIAFYDKKKFREVQFDENGRLYKIEEEVEKRINPEEEFVMDYTALLEMIGSMGGKDTNEKPGRKTIYRSLDNKLIVEASENNRIRKMGGEDQKKVVDEAYSLVEQARRELKEAGELEPEVENYISKICENDFSSLERDGKKFQNLYSQVFLPPSNYNLIYLEATEGCSHNACTMCDLYKRTNFKIKDLDEFKGHVDDVLKFHEGSLKRKKGVFLGAANPLSLPTEELVQRLKVINQKVHPKIDIPKSYRMPLSDNTLAFADVPSINRKDPEEFYELAENKLSGIFIGAESGSERVLKRLNKRHKHPDELVEAYNRIKEDSVIDVGLIFLAGFSEDHFEETRKLIEDLPLERRDIVFLSRLEPHNEISKVDENLVEEQLEGFRDVLKDKPCGSKEYVISDFFYS